VICLKDKKAVVKVAKVLIVFSHIVWIVTLVGVLFGISWFVFQRGVATSLALYGTALALLAENRFYYVSGVVFVLLAIGLSWLRQLTGDTLLSSDSYHMLSLFLCISTLLCFGRERILKFYKDFLDEWW